MKIRIGIFRAVHVHVYRIGRPDHRDNMERVLHRIVPCHRLRIAPHGIPLGAYMHRPVEIAVLRSIAERILVTQLDDIRLAAFGPAYLIVVIAHLPERRP